MLPNKVLQSFIIQEYMMDVGEDLQECATRLRKMFKFHEHLLVDGLNDASDLEMFVSKIFEKEKYTVSITVFFPIIL